MGDRVPTGIPGFDELICGGLPRGRSVLLSGTCGTGKTTFAVQFLDQGIRQYSEPGILVTLEQDKDEILNDMLSINIDLKAHQDAGHLIIIDTSLSKVGINQYMGSAQNLTGSTLSLIPGEFNVDNLVALILKAADKIDAKRVVIDSLPALDYLIENKSDIRRALIHLNYELKDQGLTTIILTEGKDEETISAHSVEEYITDGVIILRINEALDTRTIKIRKMRVTKHTLKPTTFEFTDGGITVKSPKKM